MVQACKSFLKKSIRLLGYDIHKIQLNEENKFKWFQNISVNTIFDIGANSGEFALEINKFLPDVQIYSFEPLKDIWEELVENTRDIRKFQAFNVSIGNINGKTTIKRSKFSPSSSLLEMEDMAKNAFPFIANTWEEEINIKTLDDFIKEENIKVEPEILIKLDVQGYEDKVIMGGNSIFRRARVIIIEVSFQELYKGQVLFDEIYRMLKEINYNCKGFYNVAYHPKEGLPLFADAVFVNG